VRQLHKNVGAGDPYEIDSRKSALQQAQRFDGEAGPEALLDGARHHPPPVGNAARRRNALRQRRHAAPRLQRISR
jgi:hypothetical protein